MWGRVDSLGYPSSLPLFPTADEKQERSIPVIAVEKIRENLHKMLFCSNDRNGGKIEAARISALSDVYPSNHI
jgi:hypothetical protein